MAGPLPDKAQDMLDVAGKNVVMVQAADADGAARRPAIRVESGGGR